MAENDFTNPYLEELVKEAQRREAERNELQRLELQKERDAAALKEEEERKKNRSSFDGWGSATTSFLKGGASGIVGIAGKGIKQVLPETGEAFEVVGRGIKRHGDPKLDPESPIEIKPTYTPPPAPAAAAPAPPPPPPKTAEVLLEEKNKERSAAGTPPTEEETKTEEGFKTFAAKAREELKAKQQERKKHAERFHDPLPTKEEEDRQTADLEKKLAYVAPTVSTLTTEDKAATATAATETKTKEVKVKILTHEDAIKVEKTLGEIYNYRGAGLRGIHEGFIGANTVELYMLPSYIDSNIDDHFKPNSKPGDADKVYEQYTAKREKRATLNTEVLAFDKKIKEDVLAPDKHGKDQAMLDQMKLYYERLIEDARKLKTISDAERQAQKDKSGNPTTRAAATAEFEKTQDSMRATMKEAQLVATLRPEQLKALSALQTWATERKAYLDKKAELGDEDDKKTAREFKPRDIVSRILNDPATQKLTNDELAARVQELEKKTKVAVEARKGLEAFEVREIDADGKATGSKVAVVAGAIPADQLEKAKAIFAKLGQQMDISFNPKPPVALGASATPAAPPGMDARSV